MNAPVSEQVRSGPVRLLATVLLALAALGGVGGGKARSPLAGSGW